MDSYNDSHLRHWAGVDDICDDRNDSIIKKRGDAGLFYIWSASEENTFPV